MNREERRRQDKANRPAGRSQKTIPPERLGAETQDFMAGTIFAAGAAGIRPEGPGPDLPPLFVVLLDEKSISPAPELNSLFALLDSEGTASVNAQLKGTARWGSMPAPDGQMLAKLELNLTKPVKTRPSFLLLADNYKDTWDIPATQGHVLGITTMERFAALGNSSSYADALEACIVMLPDPSTAAQMLHDHYTTGGQPPAPAPSPVLFINGDELDDMRYQVGIAKNRDGELLYPFVLLRPTGITQIPMDDGSVPKAISSAYAERGMHWFDPDALIPTADGWSWKEQGPEFIITDASGLLIASFEPETTGPEGQWLETVRSTGNVVLNVGDELVMDDGISTREQMIAAHERGNVVTGLILHAGAPAVTDVEELTKASPEEENRPWWKRLLRP
jgi:hypothetical protein